jgi:hypothetical protein
MNNIYVYNGEGSSKEAVDMLFQSLQTFCPNFTVQLISPEDIRKGKISTEDIRKGKIHEDIKKGKISPEDVIFYLF